MNKQPAQHLRRPGARDSQPRPSPKARRHGGERRRGERAARRGWRLRAAADEKKLARAPTSFMKKCESDAGAACEAKAAEKKLAGAAKTSFTKKCVADAATTAAVMKICLAVAASAPRQARCRAAACA